jgi:hypothetical protein
VQASKKPAPFKLLSVCLTANKKAARFGIIEAALY